LFGPDWNQGIIGIVASRLVDACHKPVLIFCLDGKQLKGSGRSIHEFDLHGGLGRCADLLLGYGGHRLAAGARIRPDCRPACKERFLQVARESLGDAPVRQTLRVDGELDFATASNLTFLKELVLLQPFGVGNPEPVFSSPPLTVRGRRLFGPQRNHVLLDLLDESCGVSLRAKAWRQAGSLPAFLEGRHIRLAYSPSLDMYNGIAGVDVKIRDMEILP
jgi:single-stranded-DNA-specific exonuclease